jgi:hypothetical protein
MALLQTVQDNALAQLQRAEERAERQEARHEAQLAALATRSIPPAPESAAGITSARSPRRSGTCRRRASRSL